MFEVGKKYINTSEFAGETITRKAEKEHKELMTEMNCSKAFMDAFVKKIYIPKEIIILSKSGNVYLAVNDKGEQLAVDDDDSEGYIEAEQQQVLSSVHIKDNINKCIIGKTGSGKRFTAGKEDTNGTGN